ncbi:expressed unknown protein [Seminavis robusta]|uniref:Uncharacterized protein n=1 Tax=Seminavis robusta TaxID=568900 RepID=A0A9N8H3Z3_9STRA|nr:expressed unknown protein [Seminavis robusta]|eukprot:Sro37_g023320.1 n/a (372) ;mRNA; r:102980-104228
MNDYVQFARNLLCCVKDLEVGPRFLYDHNVTAQYYEFPPPLDKTTPLEFFISWLQLYPFIFLSKAGLSMIFNGIKTVNRVQKLLENRPKKVSSSPIEKNDEIASRLVTARLVQDGKAAIKEMIIGVQCFFIGLAFFWLFSNSWHVTETPWIGGVYGLIHALTVMEICLAVLLYYMIADGLEKLRSANSMLELADTLKFKETMTTPPMNLITYQFMSQWSPFWKERDGDEKDIKQETDQVQRTLQIYRGGKDDGEKEDKIRQTALKDIVERLRQEAHTTKMEGYREFIFFVLNFIAFYGYLMGVIVFYFDDEENEPGWMKYFKFYHTHEMADWHGNFAGDLMWTIEPIVVLSSPMIFRALAPKPSESKEKAD